jgi:hypothetical protein
MTEFTPYQEKVVKRYYRSRDRIAEQRLGELVSEIYLAEGKKRDRLWQSAATALAQVGMPQSRIDHILEARDPALLAGVMKELQAKA